MEIVRTKTAGAPFKDVEVGTVFRFRDRLFLRVEEREGTMNCIRLEDFRTDYFGGYAFVIPVKSKLVVEE